MWSIVSKGNPLRNKKKKFFDIYVRNNHKSKATRNFSSMFSSKKSKLWNAK